MLRVKLVEHLRNTASLPEAILPAPVDREKRVPMLRHMPSMMLFDEGSF
jgi:hypothetical protein